MLVQLRNELWYFYHKPKMLLYSLSLPYEGNLVKSHTYTFVFQRKQQLSFVSKTKINIWDLLKFPGNVLGPLIYSRNRSVYLRNIWYRYCSGFSFTVIKRPACRTQPRASTACTRHEAELMAHSIACEMVLRNERPLVTTRNSRLINCYFLLLVKALIS